MVTITPFHSCEISDSFVHPNMKLNNGKNGNGESRLFISNNQDYAYKLADGRPWKIIFEDDYKKNVSYFINNERNFRKQVSNRKEDVINNISKINDVLINVEMQQGNKDVCRNYIGQTPHRKKKTKTIEEKENIIKWDTFRKGLVPTITTIEFYTENSEYILIQIKYNKNIHKYNKPSGCSFASLEFFDIFSKTNNIEIQTAKNGGEHKERKENGYFWPVDGYHNCRHHKCSGSSTNPCFWNNYVFEFQGDYWHKNKKNKDIEKKKFYTQLGYKWFEITESEWYNNKKVMKQLASNS
jgi:hypothetical protein